MHGLEVFGSQPGLFAPLDCHHCTGSRPHKQRLRVMGYRRERAHGGAGAVDLPLVGGEPDWQLCSGLDLIFYVPAACESFHEVPFLRLHHL